MGGGFRDVLGGVEELIALQVVVGVHRVADPPAGGNAGIEFFQQPLVIRGADDIAPLVDEGDRAIPADFDAVQQVHDPVEREAGLGDIFHGTFIRNHGQVNGEEQAGFTEFALRVRNHGLAGQGLLEPERVILEDGIILGGGADEEAVGRIEADVGECLVNPDEAFHFPAAGHPDPCFGRPGAGWCGWSRGRGPSGPSPR